MAADFKTLVNEIAVLSRGNKVTICTATEKVTFEYAQVYELDENVIDGRTANGRGVLIPGSAIQVVYIDEADD